MNAQLAARPSGWERLTEAALAYYEAEADTEFERARDNLRKSALAYARKGASGGRPATVQPEQARAALIEAGSLRRAGLLLGVSAWAVLRALRRADDSSAAT